MNKEQQELLDDAYFKRYRLEAWGECDRSWLLELDGINLTTGEKGKVHRQLTQEEFINKCKTDSKFSENWGLKIEERELSLFEKTTLYCIKMGYHSWKERVLGTIEINGEEYLEKEFTKHNIPTKLITIIYQNETIESYE